MKNKILSICISLIFLFTSLISVSAIAPTPKVELDEYEITATDTSSVFVTGTVSICVGQDVGVYDSNGKIMYNCMPLGTSNKKESFKLQIPKRYLTSSKNTFKIKSTPVKNVINGSNPKTVIVNIGSLKKDQTITANNLTLKVGESKNINASVSSGLPLTYLPKNSAIATVDAKGKVVGRKVGSTDIVISQSGNSQYNSTKKTITVKVTSSGSPQPTPTISGISYYQFNDVNKKYKLNCKSSLGKVTYKSNKSSVVSVDSSGTMTSKKPGTAVITASVKGKSKQITVVVPSIKGRVAALAPWRDTLVDTYTHIYDREYSFGKPGKWWETNGKWNGKTGKNGHTQSCLTLPDVSLQRVGLLKHNGHIWFSNGNMGSSPNSTVKNLKRTSKYVTVTYPHKSLKSLSNSGGVKYGDIVCRSGHTFVYMGTSKGSKKMYNGGTTRSLGNGAHVTWGHGSGGKAKAKTSKVKKQIKNTKETLKKYKNNPEHFKGMDASGSNWKNKIHIVVSINTFTIKTSCVNGSITPSNLYMAGQAIPIKYSSKNGKKLKSVKVDGKSVNLSTFKNSYKFTKLDRNHTIEVIYE